MKINAFSTGPCNVFNKIKHIYFLTLIGNQQLFCVILTKVKLTLNNPFTFVIILVIPPVVNHITLSQLKEN